MCQVLRCPNGRYKNSKNGINISWKHREWESTWSGPTLSTVKNGTKCRKGRNQSTWSKSYNPSKRQDRRITALQHGYSIIEESQSLEKVWPKGHNSSIWLKCQPSERARLKGRMVTSWSKSHNHLKIYDQRVTTLRQSKRITALPETFWETSSERFGAPNLKVQKTVKFLNLSYIYTLGTIQVWNIFLMYSFSNHNEILECTIVVVKKLKMRVRIQVSV